ncbi:hypothetical protein MA16_Dca024427 [Dendrobium catenatum]|uniref:Uncharacterized protein n=1 Tax=Dendrobium catenatum TaxID=906689 RepID=A0A2I0W224_9ASPA|nr:hypothetical protein MA16_Dca021062 [Dendrobium catenatum]PKU70727.1 hypothetical protein MA16_Dca024427 [Dendrobium catenatum]
MRNSMEEAASIDSFRAAQSEQGLPTPAQTPTELDEFSFPLSISEFPDKGEKYETNRWRRKSGEE